MLLHIAEDTGKVLFCPQCDRELWPAYWTEEGLEVGYWSDFAPEDGQAGLLVCGDFNCTHEEAVTFVQSPADAIIFNMEETYMHFRDEISWGWPQTWLQEYIEEIEHFLAHTGRAKLRSALEWFKQELEDRRETLDRWLAEAEKGYPVTFHTEEEKLQGRILASNAEELVLETPEGQVRVVPRNVVWQEHIEYPRKPRKARPRDKHMWFLMRNCQFMVVEGHHLAYGQPTELGGFYVGRCWDRDVAAALRLREKVPGYWEGTFRPDEIERFYWRHDFVKIRGYWVEEVSRNDEHRLVWTRTEDPEVAKALDMEPVYWMTGNEFGGSDGDLRAYEEYFSLDEIEDTRWEEEVQPLPPDHW